MIAIDNIATLDFPSFTPYKIVEMINNKQMTFDEYKKWRKYFYNY